ncbi:MAG TPA: potassium/proton antiporter [Noviherbaspirillum sp.]|nr:potassium/proton antiporter [Noviherbaspirillum sp.]
MGYVNYLLLLGAALMFFGIVFGASSSRFGVPFLLIFLVVGMLAGEDGFGGIVFHDYQLSFLVGNLALAIILLDGGLRTKMQTFRVALKPSLALATFGVVVTAGLVGLFAAWVLGLDWRVALLLGTIVGSTDAAAVFSLLKASGTRLNDRISNTLEIESGINDPMAIFLTITLIELLTHTSGALSIPAMLQQLALQFSIGLAFGIGIGYLLGAVVSRIHVGEGLHALLLCSGGVALFGLTNLVGGSGFLAIYLAGLIVGNSRYRVGENVMRAMDGMAWLAQSGMFLLLGLLATPKEVWDIAGPALAIAIFLMLVGRPVAVILSLLPFRFSMKEVGFISWVGLRGAVPIVMAMFPLLAGIEGALLIFNVAFMVVLASLLLQGTSVPFLARALGISMPERAEPVLRTQLRGAGEKGYEMAQFEIARHSAMLGAHAGTLTMPPDAHIVNVLRNGTLLRADEAGALLVDDVVTVVCAEAALDRLGEMFHGRHSPGRTMREFYGDFMLDGDARLADVAALYGNMEEHPELQALTLGEAIERRLRRAPVEGDSVEVCSLLLTVRAMEGRVVTKVGMKLPKIKSE